VKLVADPLPSSGLLCGDCNCTEIVTCSKQCSTCVKPNPKSKKPSFTPTSRIHSWELRFSNTLSEQRRFGNRRPTIRRRHPVPAQHLYREKMKPPVDWRLRSVHPLMTLTKTECRRCHFRWTPVRLGRSRHLPKDRRWSRAPFQAAVPWATSRRY
jgi:hypothetical protein